MFRNEMFELLQFAPPRKYLCPAPGDVTAATQQVLRHR
ncbi:hypothetical protein [Pseudomonas mohnii]|nr:hypothetical protein [Pseudomonas mohnii]